MPIRFRCQDCSSRVKVPEGTQGKQVKCPRCGRIQSVPHHQANNVKGDLTVHTLVGSMHKAPKRKESLVSSPAAVNQDSDRFDAYDSGDSGDSGGGVPGGLNIPTNDAGEYAAADDSGAYNTQNRPGNPGDSGHHHYRGKGTMSRKKRRRLEAQAARAKRKAELAREDDLIAESRKRVEDIFAGSKYNTQSSANDEAKTRTPDSTASAQATKASVTSQTTARPEPITLNGSDALDTQIETLIQQEPMAKVPHDYATHPPAPADTETQSVPPAAPTTATGWTLDLTAEAYPFLKLVPWVLRVAALMLIGPAFKAMLVASDQGFSAVVCMLVLFAGLTLVAVTWTVGEIATAVRDIALRNATT